MQQRAQADSPNAFHPMHPPLNIIKSSEFPGRPSVKTSNDSGNLMSGYSPSFRVERYCRASTEG